MIADFLGPRSDYKKSKGKGVESNRTRTKMEHKQVTCVGLITYAGYLLVEINTVYPGAHWFTLESERFQTLFFKY